LAFSECLYFFDFEVKMRAIAMKMLKTAYSKKASLLPWRDFEI